MDCGCGRSPTGKCIGWHKLSEEEYAEALKKYKAKEADQAFCSSSNNLRLVAVPPDALYPPIEPSDLIAL